MVWLCPLIGLNTHQPVSMGWFLIWGADKLSVSPSWSVVLEQFSFFFIYFALGRKQKPVLKWLKGWLRSSIFFVCAWYVVFTALSDFSVLFSLLSSCGTLVLFIGLKDWEHFRRVGEKEKRKGLIDDTPADGRSEITQQWWKCFSRVWHSKCMYLSFFFAFGNICILTLQHFVHSRNKYDLNTVRLDKHVLYIL